MTTLLSTPTTITLKPPGTSTLAVLAASMASGTWAQMSPTPSGLSNFLGGPTSAIRTGYATKMAYDPAGKRIYWIGCDHAQAQTFHQYDEAANAWTILAQPPFSAPTKHGYEHSTWVGGSVNKLYHRPYGGKSIYRWDGGGTWTQISYASHLSYAAAASGVEWFPNLGANGRVMLFQIENSPNGELVGVDPVTGTLTTYAEGATLAGTGDPHNIAHYSPTHQLVWFGGGNGSVKNWKINASGTVSALPDTPGALGRIGPTNNSCLPVCNPVNGNFIVFKSSSVWYELNPTGGGTWTARSGTAQAWASNVFDTAQPMWGSVACPIHQYGVIAIIKAYDGAQPAQMWLFKP